MKDLQAIEICTSWANNYKELFLLKEEKFWRAMARAFTSEKALSKSDTKYMSETCRRIIAARHGDIYGAAHLLSLIAEEINVTSHLPKEPTQLQLV